MGINYDTNITNFEVNTFEYCTLMRDLYPSSTRAYIKVHKLMPYCNEATITTSNSIFINDPECRPTLSNSFQTSDSVQVGLFASLKNTTLGEPIYGSMIDQEGTRVQIQVGGVIRKGTMMIVMFMDNNINDGYLTDFIATQQ